MNIALQDMAARDRLAGPAAGDAMRRALEGDGRLSREALDRASLIVRESGERLDAVLTRLGVASEQMLCDVFAEDSGLATASPEDYPAQALEGPPIAEAFLRQMRCVPLAREQDRIVVAVANPYDDFVEPALRFAFNLPIRRCVGRTSDIEAAIDRLYRTDEAEPDLDDAVDSEDIERLKDLVSDAPVIRAVNRLIAQAVDMRASDIHLEPAEDSLTVRFRTDGVLRAMPALPAAMRAPLVSRVKIMAGLNIAERRLPQDGRLRLAVRGHEVDLRVATAPGIHGETVVMRILDRSRLALDLRLLGFDDALAGRFRDAVGHPHGIVLVTGPTGSGKTTTLYAALSELNTPERKLLTAEDPIEYRLPGVVQTQVAPGIGFTFGSALRSFLRQDPDVIMVGEIRDRETAEIAVQAALTGHMILSTLHTNTAAGAVTRLLDMGVEPFLLGSVLTAVLSQRLVRRLCPECRRPDRPDDRLRPLFEGANRPLPDTLYHPVGCSSCSDSGYRGRLALIELLSVGPRVSQLILARADSRAVSEAAVLEGGMNSLLADGLSKASSGLTSLEEVLRVVRSD